MMPMTHDDVRRLVHVTTRPAISVFFAPDRQRPGSEGDLLRLRALVDDAAEHLRGAYSGGNVEATVEGLRAAASRYDPTHPPAALAIFATSERADVFALPSPVPDRVVVDDGFALSEPLLSMQRAEPYRFLVLAQRSTRCFEVRDGVVRELTQGFPVAATYPDEADTPHADLPKHETHAERYRTEFRAVDAALAPIDHDEPRPLVLMGPDRDVAWFREVARHPYEIVGSTRVSTTDTSFQGLRALAEPVVDEWRAARGADLVTELHEAVGAKKAVTGAHDSFLPAVNGQARLLVVESDFRRPARRTDIGLVPVDEPFTLDVVDHLAGAVLGHDGDVRFVDPGLLADVGHLGLLLRY